MLQNIMQAYTLSKTELNNTILFYLFVELKKGYLKGIILCVIKLLYGLAKTQNYWFTTYLDHHKEKLGIEMSPHDSYFLITKGGGENFGIPGLQMDNTFNIGMEAFMNKEEIEIMKAEFKAKT